MVAIKEFGVDVGYGYTKAVSADGRVVFPSIVANADGQEIDFFHRSKVNYKVEVLYPNGKTERKLVGEAAIHYMTAVSALTREKPAEIHDLLLLTAIYLLGGGGSLQDGHVRVAVGLPLAFYRTQKEALKNRLEQFNAYVQVNDENQKYISITEARVVPQGVGVLLAQWGELPERGLYAVVDIGMYTTDYLLFKVENSTPVPLLDACGSVEAGVSLVHRAVAAEFHAQTGSILPAEMLQYVISELEAGSEIKYSGRHLNLLPVFRKAKTDVGAAIVQKVLNAFGGRADFVDATIVAGGGALFFGEEVLSRLPVAERARDPLFANATGYLETISATPE